MASQERPDFGDLPAHPPRTSSRPESPAGGVRSPVSATVPKVVRPADIYKRMEHEKEKERRSSSESARRPSLDSIGRNGGESETATKPPRRPSFGMNDNGDGGRGLRPLEPVAERKSEYGFDGVTVNPGGLSVPEGSNNFEPEAARGTQLGSEPTKTSQPRPPTLQHPQARKELASGAEPVKRYSTSPTLPLLSRMSGFGGDILGLMGQPPKEPNQPTGSTPEQPQTSSTMADSVNGPAARSTPSPSTNSAHPTPSPSSRDLEGQFGASGQPSIVDPSTSGPDQAHPIRPSLPGGWVTETVTPAEMATPGSEQTKYGSDLSVKASDVPPVNEYSEEDAHTQPLRTSSPGDAGVGHAGDENQYSNRVQALPADLPSFRRSPSPRPVGERPDSQETSGGAILAKNNHDEHEHQPTPYVDALGIAPLQPRKGSAPDSSPEDLRPPILRVETYSTMDNSSPLKESDFLRDEIMRSLSPARPASEGFKDMHRDESADRESSYLSDVYGDYWSGDDDKKTEATTTTEQRGRDDGESEPASTARGESAKPPNSPAFKWTSDTAPTMSDEPAAAPAVEPEDANPETNRDRFSWETGPKDNKSAPSSSTKTSLPQSLEELTSAISVGPPDLTLPTLNFDESNSQVMSTIGTAPPGHRYSIADTSSPVSNTGDRDGPPINPGELENNFFYHEDKALLQSPMSPMSPMEPIGGIMDGEEPPPRRASTPTEAAPEGVPLPRSPSPTKPRSQPAYNSMTLKQIQQLPTSGDRVLKMQETREHFAELDSGLSGWLAEMCTREAHENAMPTYNYALSGSDAELWGTKGGARIPLNTVGSAEEAGAGGQAVGGGQSHAGGGTNTLTHMGRSASGSVNLGNLVMHSGQAGAKGKELLHSAGKLSKGLLSKGKSKLRERAESKKG